MPEPAAIAEFPTPPAEGRANEARTSLVKQRVVRGLLFIWTLLVACPIRYWPIDDSTDNTWVFALNYGAAHGLAMGRDLIWTTGPLGYLAFPMDIGHNLAQGLAFQGAVWLVLAAIFLDLFFLAGLAVRNLAYFSIFFSLSSPLYWFNFMGLENLLLAGVLVLLVLARERGGLSRYIGALALIGVIPLIKLTGGMLAGGAVLGFLAERVFHNRGKRWRKELIQQVALAAVVPLAVAAAGCWVFLPSFDALVRYGRGSLELVSGYGAAMSAAGDPMEFAGVAEALLGIGAFLFVRTPAHRRTTWFLAALLTAPLLLSIKHGFVRQDVHVINFFCFAGLALAVMALLLPLAGGRSIVAFLVLLNFGILSVEYLFARASLGPVVEEAVGFRGTRMAIDALRFDSMRGALAAKTEYRFEARIEPEMRALIGNSSVASLSQVYSGAAMEGLNLQLYPVVQRYAAYTPYLDERNAAWIRSQGPRYLLFDGHAIDGRHAWAETPAMWLEVYRWYNTRLRGTRTLLLERRSRPRFERLHSLGHSAVDPKAGLNVPASQSLVFWRMQCSASSTGALQKLLARVPEVNMQVEGPAADSHTFRVLPEVLSAPVPGNPLPGNLPELASLLDEPSRFQARVQEIHFVGPGLTAYRSPCDVEYLTPAR
jgi:hypothetical protein